MKAGEGASRSPAFALKILQKVKNKKEMNIV